MLLFNSEFGIRKYNSVRADSNNGVKPEKVGSESPRLINFRGAKKEIQRTYKERF
jgi:hypothetical protein